MLMQNFGETTKEYYGNFESGIILVHDIHVFTSNLQVISNEFWLVYRAVCPIWLVGVFTVVLIYRYSFDTTVILSVMELIAQSDKIRSSRFRCQQETIAWCNLHLIHKTVHILQRIGCESYAWSKATSFPGSFVFPQEGVVEETVAQPLVGRRKTLGRKWESETILLSFLIEIHAT